MLSTVWGFSPGFVPPGPMDSGLSWKTGHRKWKGKGRLAEELGGAGARAAQVQHPLGELARDTFLSSTVHLVMWRL